MTYFTDAEIRATGADPKDVHPLLLTRLGIFRHLQERPLRLLLNGMTTGAHDSREHPAGLAADLTWLGDAGVVDVTKAFRDARTAGFGGIGIYYNGSTYSMHLDLGMPREWVGYKKPGAKSWTYHQAVIDPRTLGR